MAIYQPLVWHWWLNNAIILNSRHRYCSTHNIFPSIQLSQIISKQWSQSKRRAVQIVACCESNWLLCPSYLPLWAKIVKVQNISVLTKWWMEHGKVVRDYKGCENFFQSTKSSALNSALIHPNWKIRPLASEHKTTDAMCWNTNFPQMTVHTITL